MTVPFLRVVVHINIIVIWDSKGALSFTEVSQAGYSLDQATRHPIYPTLAFLTAPVNCTADEIDTQAFSRLLQEARGQFDYILLDAPAGIEAGFRMAACYADRILLVTAPDPASIRDAARAGQVLHTMGKEQVRLIVNRISAQFVAYTGMTVDDIMDQSGLPLAGIVPEAPHVTLAATFSQPLLGYTRKGAAAACCRIAKRIQGHHVPVSMK